ncbi:MAG TPA: DUF3187 family protein [Chthonomonadaceae bacterium]|nr:DUF3187 family protein [Chthonomonadaceae bacterium]
MEKPGRKGKERIGQIVAWTVLLAAGWGTPARGQSAVENPALTGARGPMPVRNGRPYNLLFLQFTPELPDTLPAGGTRFGLHLDVFNNLLAPLPQGGATVQEDNETQRLLFSWRQGLGRRTELGVFVPALWRNGGFLDPFLSAWHSFFGLSGNAQDDPAGRGAQPKYRSILRLVDANGVTQVNEGNAFGPGDVSVTLKRELLPTTPRSALTLRLGLKLPTGNPNRLLGSGNVDAGLSLDGRYNVGRDILFFANVGGLLLGHANRVPNAQSAMFQGLIGVEYHPNRRDSFVFQIDGNSLAVRTGNGFADRAQVTATFGYRRVLDSRHVLFASFSENGDFHDYSLPLLSSIGPDFTISLGLEWRP